MSSDKIVHIEAGNWKTEVLEASLPVLVDFWAEWCGPCRALAPLLDDLAGELEGKLKIAKVNVDNNQQLASEFGVRSIPTLLVFKDGVVHGQFVGAMNKAALLNKLAGCVQI